MAPDGAQDNGGPSVGNGYGHSRAPALAIRTEPVQVTPGEPAQVNLAVRNDSSTSGLLHFENLGARHRVGRVAGIGDAARSGPDVDNHHRGDRAGRLPAEQRAGGGARQSAEPRERHPVGEAVDVRSSPSGRRDGIAGRLDAHRGFRLVPRALRRLGPKPRP